jgi:hypothetical protein
MTKKISAKANEQSLPCLKRRLQFYCLLLGSVIWLGSLLFATAADFRQSININRDWEFQLGDATGADTVTFDDAKWDDAHQPLPFSMPFFASDRFCVGYGWGREHFDMPKAGVGKPLNLEFTALREGNGNNQTSAAEISVLPAETESGRP